MKAYQLVKLPQVLNKLSVHLFPAKKVGLQELVPTLVVGNVTVWKHNDIWATKQGGFIKYCKIYHMKVRKLAFRSALMPSKLLRRTLDESKSSDRLSSGRKGMNLWLNALYEDTNTFRSDMLFIQDNYCIWRGRSLSVFQVAFLAKFPQNDILTLCTQLNWFCASK